MYQHHTFWKVFQLDSQKLQLKLSHPYINLSLADPVPVEVCMLMWGAIQGKGGHSLAVRL